jgi:hypothetical protein
MFARAADGTSIGCNAVPTEALHDGLAAGAVAAVLSGAPSTLHALATRSSLLEATLAAGTLLRPTETRPIPLLAAALPAHIGLSLGWAVVLAHALPERHTAAAGAAAGLAIAALDLGVIGRRFPRIRALPVAPQIGDHLAYGAVAGAVIAKRRRSRKSG